MNPLLRLWFAAAVVALSCAATAKAASAKVFPVIPEPQKIENRRGASLAPSALTHITVSGAEMPVLYGALDRLPQGKRAGAGVQLLIDSIASPESPEGYILDIDSKGATVRSRDAAGLFYGAMTLSQLIDDSNETASPLAPMHIEDFPVHPVRAVHFDSKHHLDRTEYYYRLIDRLASWKVNTVIWELEDKFQYTRRPECSAPNALSAQEMRAICDYAHERNIDINPLVQGLGHAGYILKHHWELRESPDSDWEFCPANDATYDLLFDLYTDALEAMPHGKYLHIGGDEITEIGIDERCRATGLTPFQLQMKWLQRVCDFAREHGRTPIFWDDMPLKYGDLWWVIHGGLSDAEVDANWHTDRLDEAIEMFPRDCVYMRWHYDDPTIYPHLKVLDWYKDKGLRVMGATAAADGGSPYMPRFGSKISHIHAFCRLANDYNLDEGIFATCWDDGSPHWETVQRGFAALGEYGWKPDGRDENDFREAFARNYFGLHDKGATAFIEDLENAANFFDGALIVDGRRNPAWQVRDYTLIDLPDPAKPGDWSKRHAARLDSARAQIDDCRRIATAITDARANALRNRYTLDIYQRNCELFAFPAQLLLALADVDSQADSASKDRLLALIDDFDALKADFIDTYGRTRFMTQPAGYVADMNHHKHLAALTPDAQWLFLYENACIDSIRKWLAEK